MSCIRELYQLSNIIHQIRGHICCVCVQLTRVWHTAPVLQALIRCYLCGQQSQHREARDTTKGQSYTSNKITIGLNLIAHRDKIIFCNVSILCKQRQPSACFDCVRPPSGLSELANSTSRRRVENKTSSLTLTCANVHISGPSLQSIKPIRKNKCLYFFVTCIPVLLWGVCPKQLKLKVEHNTESYGIGKQQQNTADPFPVTRPREQP